MRDISLAVVPRDYAREAVRWVVATEAVRGERSLVRLVDRWGRVDSNATAARTVPLTPPPGWQATVIERGGPLRAIYAEDGTVSAAGIRSREASEATPIAFRDGAPVAEGPALVWARRVGFAAAAKDPAQFALHWHLAEHRLRARADGLEGATWLDVAITGHQRAVVTEVLGAATVRHILADEVGLGKTIEALMIWSALSAESPQLRTIVACPKELVPQWCLEVRRRTEHAPRARRWEDLPPVYVPLDEHVKDAAEAARRDRSFSAWREGRDRRGLLVASHEGLETLAQRGDAVDLLIVDEAHRLTTSERDAVKKIARRALHVLLLTATPRESARRLAGAARARVSPFAWALSMVDPRCEALSETLPSIDRQLQEQYTFLRDADAALVTGACPPEDLLAQAIALSDDHHLTAHARSDVRALAREATYFDRVVSIRRQQIAREDMAERRLCQAHVEYREEELQVFRALRDMDAESSTRARVRRYSSSSWAALADAGRGLSESARQRLAVVREARVDAKLDALLDLCARIWRDDSERKVVIRCEYGPTFVLVSDRLRELLLRGALRRVGAAELEAWSSDDSVGPVARLEEGTESMISALVNPDHAGASMLAHFNAFERRGPGSAPVLVARDVAAVGLNLQFSQDLIFYDVPWQVGLAEQWIGRLDRLGQRGRDLRVHVLTHPESPVSDLVDVYVALKLFDATRRRATELDDHVSSLITKADSDEIAWSDVVARAKALLDEDTSEVEAERAIDLRIEVEGSVVPSSERDANHRVVRAFQHAGFALEQKETRYEVRWPPGRDRDVVDLPEVRSQLRPPVRAIGGRHNTPEHQAEEAERANHDRLLRVETNRLSDSRWVRGGAVDFLTPRHPLLSQALDELAADPTLCLGAFQVRRADGLPEAGIYALALTCTFPGASAASVLWDGRPLEALDSGDPSADPELRQFYEQVEGGLRRAFCIAFPPRTAVRAWRLSADLHELPDVAAASLRDALPGGTRVPLGDASTVQFKRALALAERAPNEVTPTAATAAIDRALRHVRFVGAAVIAKRESTVAAVGEDTALRGIRDRHQRTLDTARAFFGRLERQLDRGWPSIAVNASTPRVVAAAWMEVR